MRGLDSASFREIIFIHTRCSGAGVEFAGNRYRLQGREPECKDWAKGSARVAFGTDRLDSAFGLPHFWGFWGSQLTAGYNECEHLILMFFLLFPRKGKKTIDNKVFSYELCFMAYNFHRAVGPCLFDLTHETVLGLL